MNLPCPSPVKLRLFVRSCLRFLSHGTVVLGSLTFLGLGTAWAQGNYPARAVTIVVGYPPGGSIDLTARTVGGRAVEPAWRAGGDRERGWRRRHHWRAESDQRSP